MKRHYFLSILVLFALLFSACVVAASAFCVEVNVEPVKPVTILDIAAAAMAAAQPQPEHIERCPLCTDGRVRYSHTTRGEWCTATNNPCAHGDRRASDAEQVRGVVTYYTCDRCNFGTFHQTEEQRTVCHSKG